MHLKEAVLLIEKNDPHFKMNGCLEITPFRIPRPSVTVDQIEDGRLLEPTVNISVVTLYCFIAILSYLTQKFCLTIIFSFWE